MNYLYLFFFHFRTEAKEQMLCVTILFSCRVGLVNVDYLVVLRRLKLYVREKKRGGGGGGVAVVLRDRHTDRQTDRESKRHTDKQRQREEKRCQEVT